MSEELTDDQHAILRDKDLAWELVEIQPENPLVLQLAASVLAREPSFTGMVVVQAQHYMAVGDIDRGRELLRGLIGSRDRQHANAARYLRDYEFDHGEYAESMKLALYVLREHPNPHWGDHMDLGAALLYAVNPAAGWEKLDEAVAMCASEQPDEFADALSRRASFLLFSGAPPERCLVAAQEAIEADPTDITNGLVLAFAYLFHYRVEEAETLALRLLRDDPTNGPAQAALQIARSVLTPLRSGEATMDEFREMSFGDFAWLTLYEQMFGIGLPEALEALNACMPADLAASLLPPLTDPLPEYIHGDKTLMLWHSGQSGPATDLWRCGHPWRLMSEAELVATAADPDDSGQSDPSEETAVARVFTDDNDGLLYIGRGGRFMHEDRNGDTTQVARSLADWLWDRVVAFGGTDPRPHFA